MPVIGVLYEIGQDFGYTAMWVSSTAWLGAVILFALGCLVGDLVTGNHGDPYAGGRAP